MQQILLVIHVIICLGLASLVLVQHGKGANMGSAFRVVVTGGFGAQPS